MSHVLWECQQSGLEVPLFLSRNTKLHADAAELRLACPTIPGSHQVTVAHSPIVTLDLLARERQYARQFRAYPWDFCYQLKTQTIASSVQIHKARRIPGRVFSDTSAQREPIYGAILSQGKTIPSYCIYGMRCMTSKALDSVVRSGPVNRGCDVRYPYAHLPPPFSPLSYNTRGYVGSISRLKE